jgi:hypothetical protein
MSWFKAEVRFHGPEDQVTMDGANIEIATLEK